MRLAWGEAGIGLGKQSGKLRTPNHTCIAGLTSCTGVNLLPAANPSLLDTLAPSAMLDVWSDLFSCFGSAPFRTSCLQTYPALVAFYKRVAELPGIKEYLASPARWVFIIYI